MLGQLNLVLWAWLESFKDVGRFRLWLPFLTLALVQAVVAVGLTQFWRPGLSLLGAPLVSGLSGPGALHYPQFYLALPIVFSKLNFLIDATVGSLCLGIAMLAVWARVTGDRSADPWGLGRRRVVGLVLVRLPLVVLLYLLAWALPPLLFTAGTEAPGSQVRLLRYATFGAGILLETLFAFAPVFLLLERESVARAWKSGVAFLGRVPLAAVLVVFAPSLLQLPVSYVLRRADRIVEGLSPELVLGLVVGAVFAFAIVNFFVVGAIVRLYGARADNPGGKLSWH